MTTEIQQLHGYMQRKGWQTQIFDKNTLAMQMRTTINDHGLGDNFSRSCVIRNLAGDNYAVNIQAKARAINPSLGELYTQSISEQLMEAAKCTFAEEIPYIDAERNFPIDWDVFTTIDENLSFVEVSGMFSVRATFKELVALVDKLYELSDIELVQKKNMDELYELEPESNHVVQPSAEGLETLVSTTIQ